MTHLGLQICIDHDTEHTPELHYGDAVIRKKYIGSGIFDALVEFIEANLRKPWCSIASPEACPEEECEGVLAIEELTREYFEKLSSFGTENPEKIASQSFKKFGIKNTFQNDYDDYNLEEEYEFPELMFDGRPRNEDVY